MCNIQDKDALNNLHVLNEISIIIRSDNIKGGKNGWD